MATTPVIWEAEVSDQPGLHGVGGHLRFILRPCLNLPTPPKKFNKCKKLNLEGQEGLVRKGKVWGQKCSADRDST